MKKIIAFLLIMCLCLSLPVFADEYSGYKEVRIGLYFGSTALSEVKLESENGFNICFGEDRNYGYHYSMLEKELIVKRAGETDFYLGPNYLMSNGQIAIRSAGKFIKINGKEYRGFVSLKICDGGKFTLINVVDTESYLYSVVGKEMSPSWNIEALKAQAVCARTYTMKNLNKYKSYGFDLCATQSSQVYDGVSAEYPSTIRAVDETKWQTVRYDGKPCEVFYFASSGGITANVEHVWGTHYPHLRSVLDIYERPEEATKYRWEVTFTKDEIKNTLSKKGVNIGEIKDVKVTGDVMSGRVTEITFYGSDGEYAAKREKARTILGLSSQLYKIVPLEDGSYRFDGKGWGHAVGMSQWGAKAMAEEGFSYDEILKFYFTDVEIY